MTSYFPDYAMLASVARDTLNFTDSTTGTIKVPAVKLYSSKVKFSATVSPAAPFVFTWQGRDSLTSYPDSVTLKIKTNNVLQGNYTVTVTGQGPNGTPVHTRTLAIRVQFVVPVPIQLASFTGTHLGSTRVRLNWRTISEVNNYGFYVMRRQENETSFTEISQLIPGHGTTNEPQHYSWTDSAAMLSRWYYKLRQIDLDGTEHYTEPILVDVTTSVSEENGLREFRLEQNYPNPFNPSTEIKFSVAAQGRTTLSVYNSIGQEVATLFDDFTAAGQYRVQFNGTNLASGVYIYRLASSGYVGTKHMILIK